jgi:serine/threonine protein kinase
MVLEALGPNLRHLEEATPKKRFSKPSVFLLAIQLVERLRDLHSLGYVHNDIKLENILIGYKESAKIYLIDFGLSQPYIDPINAKHVVKKNLAYFSGNFMFASLNSCRGNNKSRRDDIESLFYLIIYLYNENFLPWRDYRGTFK